MKYIEKEAGNEPSTLKEYRETTPNATYKGFGDTGQLLKKALLVEQGHICAYCMQRITLKLNEQYKPKIEVEHFQSQKKYPDKDLDYNNMLGVCNGNLGGNEHCDKSKKEKSLTHLNPLKPEIEHCIVYSTSGRIEANGSNKHIEDELNEILNLNNQNLIDNRKNLSKSRFKRKI